MMIKPIVAALLTIAWASTYHQVWESSQDAIHAIYVTYKGIYEALR